MRAINLHFQLVQDEHIECAWIWQAKRYSSRIITVTVRRLLTMDVPFIADLMI